MILKKKKSVHIVEKTNSVSNLKLVEGFIQLFNTNSILKAKYFFIIFMQNAFKIFKQFFPLKNETSSIKNLYTIKITPFPGPGGAALWRHHRYYIRTCFCLMVISGPWGTGALNDPVPVATTLVVSVTGARVDQGSACRAIP